MRRALVAGTVYFGILFAIGFVLGTIRVLFMIPRWGEVAATLAEVPVMLAAALVICDWVIRRWRIPRDLPTRGAMTLWFLALLIVFETLLGAVLFGRTMTEQWAALTTPAGLLGFASQLIAALFPLVPGIREP